MFPRNIPEIAHGNEELRVVRSFSVFKAVYDLAKDCAPTIRGAG
jgi:hypothetical protein